MDSIDSVESTVSWLQNNPSPDLTSLDIHLADGNSFEIFESAEVTAPIIFSTAFDQYAIQALKVNSADCLLKPVDQTNLYRALIKFEKQQMSHSMSVNISELVKSFTKNHKSRFVIKAGEHLRTVETDNIFFFFSENKITYLQTNEGKRYIIGFPLDKIETMIDPLKYFRINRKYPGEFSCYCQYLNSLQ